MHENDSNLIQDFLDAIDGTYLSECLKDTCGPALSLGSLEVSSQTFLQSVKASLDTNIRSIWPLYHSMLRKHHVNMFSTRIERQQLLLVNMTIWEWLNDSLAHAYDAIINPQTEPEPNPIPGLDLLMSWVRTMLDSGRPGQTLDAADFFEGFPQDEVKHELKTKRTRFDPVTLDVVIKSTGDIVSSWFSFPTCGQLRIQAWFCRKLVDQIGIEALILDCVWEAAHHIKRLVLGRGRNSTITREDITEWACERLAQHLLSDPRSSEQHLLQQVYLAHRPPGEDDVLLRQLRRCTLPWPLDMAAQGRTVSVWLHKVWVATLVAMNSMLSNSTNFFNRSKPSIPCLIILSRRSRFLKRESLLPSTSVFGQQNSCKISSPMQTRSFPLEILPHPVVVSWFPMDLFLPIISTQELAS